MGFYLSSGLCKEISRNLFLSDCAWFNEKGCQLCQKDFFYNGESCQEAGNRIPGCEYYNFRDHGQSCLQCSLGKTVLGGLCVDKAKNDENCVHFVDFGCQKCSSGHTIHENRLLRVVLSEPSNQVFSLADYFKSQELSFYKPPALFCSKKHVENCQNYDSNGACLECFEGFSLMGRECRLISEKTVAFCSSYLDLGTCRECQMGHFLTPSGDCLPIVPKLFCASYSRESRDSRCVSCLSSFYLSQNRVCMRRLYSRSISQCDVYSISSDTCQKCKTGFHLSSDNLKCFPEISECAEYAPSNRQSTVSECARCNANFHFDTSGNCVAGNLDNCEIFKLSSNICEQCKSGHFLETQSGKCVKHEEGLPCEFFDSQNRDKCRTHKADFQELAYSNMCVPVENIINCVSYSRSELTSVLQSLKSSQLTSSEFWAKNPSQFKCEECKPGFQPSPDGTACVEISLDPHCVSVFNSQCIDCGPLKMVSTKGTCIDLHPLDSSFCAKPNSSVFSFGCFQCESGAIAIDANSSTLCLDESNLKYLDGETMNCDLYKLRENGVKECLSCVDGFSLNLDTKECTKDDLCNAVIKHPLQTSPVIPNSPGSGYIGTNLFSRTESICAKSNEKPASPVNCRVFVPGLNGKLGCIKCEPDHVPLFDISKQTNISKNFLKFNENSEFLSKVSFRQEISECVPKSSVVEVSNCSKYFRIDQTNIGCLSCVFGFIGKVNSNQKSISECIDADSSGCLASRRLEGLDWDSSSRSLLQFSWGNSVHG